MNHLVSYPQPLKDAQVLFSLMASGWVGEQMGKRQEKNIVQTISQKTMSCRKLITWLGFRCATSWCNLDMTFDLVIVTLTFKISSGLYLRKVRCRMLRPGRDIGWGCRCPISWFDLDLTFDLAVVPLILKILSGLCLRNHKVGTLIAWGGCR